MSEKQEHIFFIMMRWKRIMNKMSETIWPKINWNLPKLYFILWAQANFTDQDISVYLLKQETEVMLVGWISYTLNILCRKQNIPFGQEKSVKYKSQLSGSSNENLSITDICLQHSYMKILSFVTWMLPGWRVISVHDHFVELQLTLQECRRDAENSKESFILLPLQQDMHKQMSDLQNSDILIFPLPHVCPCFTWITRDDEKTRMIPKAGSLIQSQQKCMTTNHWPLTD